jgi:hypothetical protein
MKTIIASLASALFLMACGGSSPVVQYMVNTDALATVTQGAAGSCDATEPTNVTETSSENESSHVLSLYQLDDGTTFAEVTVSKALNGASRAVGMGTVSGRHALTGTSNNDSYSLTDSEGYELESAEGDPSSTTGASVVLSLKLTVDGDFVSGTLSAEGTSSCTGAGCPAGFEPTDCVYEVQLRGQKLPDDGIESVRAGSGS